MARARWVVLLCAAGWAMSAGAQAPAAYTLKQESSFSNPPTEQTIYRNGSKAAIDTSMPAQNGTPAMNSRSIYDLTAHTNISWNLADASAGCATGTFSGDWGDPFASNSDLAGAKQTGTETLNGFSTKVYEASEGGVSAKIWIDAKTGMAVKEQMTQGTTTQTMSEVKSLTVGAPPASVFAIPANCTAPGGPPPVTQREKDIAAETTSGVGDFVDAVMTSDAGSVSSCSVNIRVMNVGTMKPIISGFKLSAKVLDDQGNDGAALTVTAGANGVWRLNNAPARFDMTEDFGDAGGGGGTVRRWCISPTSTLLLVVKDPTKLGLGADWLWDVNGKYAAK